MDWIPDNWIEILGALIGFVYIFFEIKASKWMWPIGLITSLFYIVVYFDSKFYADMSLQFYYIFISIYGWYWWINGGKISGKEELPISRINPKQSIYLSIVFVFLLVITYYILKYFTDSPLPFGDAFTTALSIIATWMLAQKIIEQWLLWVVIDLVSVGLYLYKDLYPTSILFLVYSVLAVLGYYQWQKSIKLQSKPIPINSL